MTYGLAILSGGVGAVVGYAIAAAATTFIGALLGASNFEGGLAMLAFFAVGPIGGVIGLVVGIWVVLRQRGHRSASALAWRIPAGIAGIVVLVAGGVWLAYDMRPMLGTSSSGAPRLDFEIRMPPGAPVQPARTKVNLSTERNTADGIISDKATRMDGDRPVIAGTVELYYRSSWRLLDLRRGDDQPIMIFDLGLAARPAHMEDFGPWRRVTSVGTNGPGQPRKATDADAYEIRTRVVYREAEIERMAAPAKK